MPSQNQKSTPGSEQDSLPCQFIPSTEIQRFVSACLAKAGADTASVDAVTRSLVGASLRGVDSHGIRLLPHYVKALRGGRINGAPQLKFSRRSGCSGCLDADDGFGHLAGYRAIEEATTLAQENGLGAVSVINSSHFGAAGSYPLVAAEAGYLALCFSNSDKLVLPFSGLLPFHGTNPISFAAPVANQHPYLLDMATSSIPLNRVLQYRAISRPLPEDVAVNDAGETTIDAAQVSALLPVGGQGYGYKGAALAGLCEILCAALTGMGFSHQLLAMAVPDYSSRRHLGHFFLVIKPEAFIERDIYFQQMDLYLADLRAQVAESGAKVMAAGDREWAEQERRRATGIPVDHAVMAEFADLAREFELQPLN